MDNFHSKIFKREDGSQVKVEVYLYAEYFRNTELKYQHSLFTREKGKRKWRHIPTVMGGALCREALDFISEIELLEVKTEFWRSIKP